MKTRLLKRAEQIAASGYQLQIEREDEHNGPTIYIAYISEIPACVAQGDSPEQAKVELQTVLVDVIAYMLESGLQVPVPETHKGTATVQVGESQATQTLSSAAHKPLVVTGSHELQLNRSAPHTSWAVASVPSRVRA